jgi:predicted membrane protein
MRRNLFLGIVLITIGVLFLLNNLEVADFGDMVHDYWPLILIVWGLSIVMRGKAPSNQTQPTSPETTETVDRDLVHESNVFGSIYIKNTSQNFLGGSVSTVFGDCDLDLSASVIAEGEHELRFHTVFGSSSIILPRDAAVSISANSTFGSLTILGQRKEGISSALHVTTPNYDSSSKRLKISISKVFGDARIS